ncbi:LysR substrate-binding domain-containing protein [uncultured Caballeronia sp.]|uniref:LysR family transcriptional regulator n=1 Tax=uncultured Caballeronia sp. TaxID=1827198 RepID=UPI001575F635
MDSNDLDLFARVCRAGSISRAALEAGSDQSTISRRIAAIEAELGVRLFRRSGRGVALTERGEQLLTYALETKRMLDEASRTLRSSSALGPARLCIAAQPTIARIMFGPLAHALKAHFSSTQVRFVEGLASQLLGALKDGELDVGILYAPEHRGALAYDLLLTEGVCLITPEDYPLDGETIDVRALASVPLILPSTHHGLRMLVESLATRHGFSLNVAFECDGSISLTKRLVLANCGCTVLPSAAVVEEMAAGRVKCFRLENPPVTRDVGLFWPQHRAGAGGIWQVSRLIRDCAETLVRRNDWPGTQLVPG